MPEFQPAVRQKYRQKNNRENIKKREHELYQIKGLKMQFTQPVWQIEQDPPRQDIFNPIYRRYSAVRSELINECSPEVHAQEANHDPENPISPNACRIRFGKFLAELLRPARPPAREPKGIFIVQPAILQFRDGIAQMHFQFLAHDD